MYILSSNTNHYQLLKIQDRQDAEDDARRQDLLESAGQKPPSASKRLKQT